MAIALVSSVTLAAGSGGTTAAIDTTGATLLVLSVASYSANPVSGISDSKGNTWTALTARTQLNVRHQFYFALAPTVGTGHTFTVSAGAFVAIGARVLAFSGVTRLQNERGATGTTSPLSTGSSTPLVNGALILTALGSETAATDSIATAGFTLVGTVGFAGGSNMQESSGYLIQSTAAAINPQWSWTGSHAAAVASLAVFTDLAIGGTSSSRWRLNITDGNDASFAGIATFDMASVAAGANLCVGGLASASAVHSAPWVAANAFDANTGTAWVAPSKVAWVEYEFTSAVTIAEYRLFPYGSSQFTPKNWTLEYWSGAAWVVADTRTNQTGWTAGVTRTYSGIVTLPTDGRVSQLPVEVLVLPPPTNAGRISQLPIEALVSVPGAVPAAESLDVTHVVAEVLAPNPAEGITVTQLLIEIIRGPATCPDVNFPLLPTCSDTGFPRMPEATVEGFPILPEGDCMDASTFIVNMALAEVGITKTIAALASDTSQEAYVARLVYTEVMDTVLRDHPWGFATEYAALPWVAGSPAAPVNPDWVYTYRTPDDCVRVRRVCDPVFARRYTTTPIPWDLRADDEAHDLLLCNEPGAGQLPPPLEGEQPTVTIEYTKRLMCVAQVNDAQFREAIVYKLAARLAKALARDSKDADRCLRNYLAALPKAQTQHANDEQPQRPIDAPPDWIQGR